VRLKHFQERHAPRLDRGWNPGRPVRLRPRCCLPPARCPATAIISSWRPRGHLGRRHDERRTRWAPSEPNGRWKPGRIELSTSALRTRIARASHGSSGWQQSAKYPTGTRRPAPVSVLTSSNLGARCWPFPRRITNLTKYPAADQKSVAFASGIGYSFCLLKYFSKAWLFSAQIDSSCLRLTRCQRTAPDQG
jgi:hypothetical protein